MHSVNVSEKFSLDMSVNVAGFQLNSPANQLSFLPGALALAIADADAAGAGDSVAVLGD